MKNYILIFLLLLCFQSAYTQKVALVLSGGGAKGLAHVSVLKELEKNNIPIDYVIGNSMGAIVGGFYAAGYSPDTIEEIVLSNEFQNWIVGKSRDLYNKHFFSKPENSSFFSIGLNLNESLSASLNTTLADDAVINFKLAEYLAHASRVSGNDFDSLFVPFRTIAADIFTQKEVILRDGNLAESVRASMAVPFFYDPVRVKNDKLLFDGGLYNNFPVEVAINEFNPDLIIGVNVSAAIFEEYPYENDRELIEENLFMYIMNKSDPSTLKEKDVYIEPDLRGLNGMEFGKVKEFLDSGEIAVKRKIPEIKSKISRRIPPAQLNEKRVNFNIGRDNLVINSVQFRGFDLDQINYLSKIFQLKKYSDLTIDQVREGYFKLISEDYFRNVYPKIYYNKNDSSLIFEIKGKNNKTINIDFGGFITSRSFSELFLGVRFNSFNENLAEHALQLYTGSFYQSVNYYSRFSIPGEKLFYIEPVFTYNKWDFIDISDIFFGENIAANFAQQNDIKAGINAGIPLGLKYKTVFSACYLNNGNQYSNTEFIQSSDILDDLKFDGFRTGIKISKNSMNRKQYPDEGEKFTGDLSFITGWERFDPGSTSMTAIENNIAHQWFKLKLSWERYEKIGSRWSAGWMVESVLSNQPFFSNYQGTILNAPSFDPLNDSKLRIIPEFRSFQYLSGGLRLIYNPFNKINIRLEGYVFKPVEHITEIEPQVPGSVFWDDTINFAASLNPVYHSPIGPLSLSLNYYNIENAPLTVMMHIGYMIFNPRSMD